MPAQFFEVQAHKLSWRIMNKKDALHFSRYTTANKLQVKFGCRLADFGKRFFCAWLAISQSFAQDLLDSLRILFQIEFIRRLLSGGRPKVSAQVFICQQS